MKDKMFVTFNISKTFLNISSILQKNNSFIKAEKNEYISFNSLNELNEKIQNKLDSFSRNKQEKVFLNFIFEDNFFENYTYVLEETKTLSYEDFISKNNISLKQTDENWIINSEIYKFQLINNGISKTYSQFPENTDYEQIIIHTSSLYLKRSELVDIFLSKLVADLNEIERRISCKFKIMNSSQILASENRTEKPELLIDLNENYLAINLVRNGIIIKNSLINFSYNNYLKFLSEKFQILSNEVKYRVKYLLGEKNISESANTEMEIINQKIAENINLTNKRLAQMLTNYILQIKSKINIVDVLFTTTENTFFNHLFKQISKDLESTNVPLIFDKKSQYTNIDFAKNIEYKTSILINKMSKIETIKSQNKTITTEIVLEKLFDKKLKMNFLSSIFSFLYTKKIL